MHDAIVFAAAQMEDTTTLVRQCLRQGQDILVAQCLRVGKDEDQRVRRISLTDAGKDILDEALPLWRKAQSRLVESLGRERWSGESGRDCSARYQLSTGPVHFAFSFLKVHMHLSVQKNHRP